MPRVGRSRTRELANDPRQRRCAFPSTARRSVDVRSWRPVARWSSALGLETLVTRTPARWHGNSLDATPPGVLDRDPCRQHGADPHRQVRLRPELDLHRLSVRSSPKSWTCRSRRSPVVISGDTDRTPDGGGTFGLLRNNVLEPAQGRRLHARSGRSNWPRSGSACRERQLTVADGVISGGGKSATLRRARARGRMLAAEHSRCAATLTDFARPGR